MDYDDSSVRIQYVQCRTLVVVDVRSSSDLNDFKVRLCMVLACGYRLPNFQLFTFSCMDGRPTCKINDIYSKVLVQPLFI